MTRYALLFLMFTSLGTLPAVAILKGSNATFMYIVKEDGTLEILNKLTLTTVTYDHKRPFFKGEMNRTYFCGLYDESERCYSLEVIELATGKRVYQFCVSKQTKTFTITETHIYLPNYATGELKIISFENMRHHDRMTICYQTRNFVAHDGLGFLTSDFDQHSIFIADLKIRDVPQEICLKPFLPKALSLYKEHLYVAAIHPDQPSKNYIAIYGLCDFKTCKKIPISGQPTFMAFSESHLYTLDPQQRLISVFDLKNLSFVGTRKLTCTDTLITSFVFNNSLYINHHLECAPHPADNVFEFYYFHDLHWSYMSSGITIFNDYIPLILKDEAPAWTQIAHPENHLGCAVKLKFIEDNPLALIDVDDLRSSPQVMEAVLKTPQGTKAVIRQLCTLIWEDKLTHNVSFLAKTSGKLTDDPKAYLLEFFIRIKHPDVMAFAALAFRTKKALTPEDEGLIAICKKYASPKLVNSFTEEVPPVHG